MVKACVIKSLIRKYVYSFYRAAFNYNTTTTSLTRLWVMSFDIMVKLIFICLRPHSQFILQYVCNILLSNN